MNTMFRLSLLSLCLLLGCSAPQPFGAAEQNRAIARAIRGTADFSTDGGAKWKRLKAGTKLNSGTSVRAASGSSVDLFMNENGPFVRVAENSTVAIRTLTVDRTGVDNLIHTELQLQAGRISGIVRTLSAASKYIIRFPSGYAEVQKTLYDISADGTVGVIEGTVPVTYNVNNAVLEPVLVKAGQAVSPPTAPGEAPTVKAIPPDVLKQISAELKSLMVVRSGN